MRADAARAWALIFLVLVASGVGYVGFEYTNARARVAAEDQAERNRRAAEIEAMRRSALEKQPEIYVPPAPIIANVF